MSLGRVGCANGNEMTHTFFPFGYALVDNETAPRVAEALLALKPYIPNVTHVTTDGSHAMRNAIHEAFPSATIVLFVKYYLMFFS